MKCNIIITYKVLFTTFLKVVYEHIYDKEGYKFFCYLYIHLNPDSSTYAGKGGKGRKEEEEYWLNKRKRRKWWKWRIQDTFNKDKC